MGKKFVGKTGDVADTPFLGAEFWKKGTKILGSVTRVFQTQNGQAYNLVLATPATVDGKKYDVVSMGAMKGFDMALQAAGCNELEKGDDVEITCTGFTKTDKGNPRVDFEVSVNRL